MNKTIRHGEGVPIKTLKRRTDKRSKKILVPLDGSNASFRALKFAMKRAQEYSHEIIGLYVIPSTNFRFVPSISDLTNEISQRDIKFLRKADQLCNKRGIEFSSKTIRGEIGKQIVNFAKTNKADEIVMGHSNMGRLGRFFLGSVSNYVINKTKLPVTLVK